LIIDNLPLERLFQLQNHGGEKKLQRGGGSSKVLREVNPSVARERAECSISFCVDAAVVKLAVFRVRQFPVP
jgi:hypothetical protein